MCGIFAQTGTAPKDAYKHEALSALRKRGPDDADAVSLPGCTLGQTRLSIVDIGGGHQPMTDATGRFTITFNGEIYDYKKLREDLIEKKCVFKTNSDTEVILNAYAEYGESCVSHLDGMFAFAIWDAPKEKLFLARDRFGKKPLYYAFTENGELVVASEIKALFALGITGEIDPVGIDTYLALMYIPPWRTIYKNVFTLSPGTRAIFENKQLTTQTYWKLEEKNISISYEEAKEESGRLLREAVRKRMVADVEIGSFLSGGVDSSLITGYAQELSSRPLKTFSLGYGDYINELPYAAEAAEAFKTDHHTLQANTNIINEIHALYSYLDEPHGDSADFAQHLLSQFTAQHVKVALAGDGGDELFMGYGWYWAQWNRRKILQLKSFLFSDPFTDHLSSIQVFGEHERRKLFINPSVVGIEKIDRNVAHISTNDAHKINAYDLTTYLPGQLLTKVDRTSMMHGLEVRCPLLDYRLAEFAYSLPLSYKMNKSTGKFILKDLLAEKMPRSFVDRKKQGFGAPVRKWLQEPAMQALIRETFAKNAYLYQFLHKEHIRPFIEKTLRGNNQKQYYQVWVLLCLEMWLSKHYN